MQFVRTGPLTGLVCLVALLALLTDSTGLGTPGLGPAGWLAGLGYGAVLCALLTGALDRHGVAVLGPANRVTLARAVLVGAVLALVADSFTRPVPAAVPVALATVALLLDAVDGLVARRTGTVSALGARFDMETDALLILVLSGWVATRLGGWVLAIGAMRYGYALLAWAVPVLAGPVPARYWRKVVAAVQGAVLLVTATGLLPRPLAVAALATALAALVWSFATQAVWLVYHRPARVSRTGPPVPVAAAGALGRG